MPLQRRIPKRGFTNIFRKEYVIVNVQDLETMAGPDPITPEMLMQKGLIKNIRTLVKVLGTGEIKAKLVVHAHKFSKSAQEKILAAGGKAEVI